MYIAIDVMAFVVYLQYAWKCVLHVCRIMRTIFHTFLHFNGIIHYEQKKKSHIIHITLNKDTLEELLVNYFTKRQIKLLILLLFVFFFFFSLSRICELNAEI